MKISQAVGLIDTYGPDLAGHLVYQAKRMVDGSGGILIRR